MNWDWKEWAKAAGIRAIKTFAQTMLGCITVGMTVQEVDWVKALSISAVACVASIFTSLTGLPEVEKKEGGYLE